MRQRLQTLLSGGHPRLPRPVDALSEQWWRLRPRVRTLAVATVVVLAAAGMQSRISAAESRWGGEPRTVLVADRDLPVGAPADGLRRRPMPPLAVPDGALTAVPDGAVLSFALPAGGVLTATHLDGRGPAAGLARGLRAVPVPAEQGWGVVRGGWVDVWVLGAGDAPAALVASSRPVLDVRSDPAGATAIVGMAADEVGPTTEGLALGRVLLTHAPAPSATGGDDPSD